MRLFKYVRAERIDILEAQRIAFTPPEEFNDVLDIRPKVIPLTSRAVLKRRAKDEEAEVLKEMPPSFHALPRKQRREKQREILKSAIKHMQKNAGGFAKQLQQDLRSGINKHFGILCLTANPDHKLMWGHYADGHRGFVLEFNTDDPRFALTDEINRVVYSDVPPTYDQAAGSQGWWKVKSKDWEYEGEYRIVTKLENCERKSCSDGKVIYLRHLPRECVKSVFMGLMMEGPKKHRLREICRPAGIDVFEAEFLKDGVSYEFRKAK